MYHQTMTYREILEAEQALGYLKGFKDHKAADKVARTMRWVRARSDDFRQARKMLVDGHAQRDGEGKIVTREEADPMTGHPQKAFVPEDKEAWEKALADLLEQTVNLSGVTITAGDLATLKEVVDPQVRVSLGKLYDWGEGDDDADDKED